MNTGEYSEHDDSENESFEIGKLRLESKHFYYAKKRYLYEEVFDLRWRWESTTINLVNTQNVKLEIFVSNEENSLKLSKITMYVKPALVEAYNIIAQKTFQYRLKPFIEQLENDSYFEVDGIRFYCDGNVSDGKQYFLMKDADIQPFNLKFSKGGFFGPSIKLSLEYNKDVILTLMNHIIRNPVDRQKLIKDREARSIAKKKFEQLLFATFGLFGKIAIADGIVSPEEIDIVKDFIKKIFGGEEEITKNAIYFFNSARNTKRSFRDYAQLLKQNQRSDADYLQLVLDTMVILVLNVDGLMSVEEELIIKEVEVIFQVRSFAYHKYQEEIFRSQKQSNKEEYRFAKILGIEDDISVESVKSSYRRLIKTYHPDKVYHLGNEYVKLAEEKMKDVNLAYNYFMKKFNL